MTTDTAIVKPQALTDQQEALAYIIEMIEELAKMAARNALKDLSSDLFVVATEARRRALPLWH